MLDTREYEWSDISVVAGGKDIVGLQYIKILSKQDKKLKFGKGKKAKSIQRGNIENSGEIGMAQSDYETLRLNSSGGSVLNERLEIIVAYGNPIKGDVMITKIIHGVEFTEEANEGTQGDTSMDVKLPFLFLDISNEID